MRSSKLRVMKVSDLISVLALAMAPLMLASCAQSDAPGFSAAASEDIVIIESKSGAHRFTIEFADTDEKRKLGLMHRTEMAADAGMLFDFGEPQPISMWMKNTLIPLDMAFIDETGIIKNIAANTTPRSLESIRSGAPVVAVLEVNGGTLARLGVEAGDQVRHPMFAKKQR